LLVLIYWLLPSLIIARKIKTAAVFLYAPIVLASLFASTFLGMLSGFFKKYLKKF